MVVDQRNVEPQLRTRVSLAVRVLRPQDVRGDVDVSVLIGDHQRQLNNPSLSLLTVVYGRGAASALDEIHEIMGPAPDGSSRWVAKVKGPEEFELMVFERLLYVIDLGSHPDLSDSSDQRGLGDVLEQQLPHTPAQAENMTPDLYRRL